MEQLFNFNLYKRTKRIYMIKLKLEIMYAEVAMGLLGRRFTCMILITLKYMLKYVAVFYLPVFYD